jgi:hypothetical protein
MPILAGEPPASLPEAKMGRRKGPERQSRFERTL